MLPIERQQQILTWLEIEETLTISDVSNRLGVSEMTIYRDIKPLIDQNKIMKTSKGIAMIHSSSTITPTCSYCFKNSMTRHSMQMITNQQIIEHTCCPHCGLLRYNDNKDNVSQIICRDFLTDLTISAKTAHYLIGADFNLNCCQPQVLAFGFLKQAQQFQKGFGGKVFSFHDATLEIQRMMDEPTKCNCDR